MAASNPVSRSFQRWIDAQDVPTAIAASAPSAWMSLGALTATILAATYYVPGLREAFHIRPLPIVICFLVPSSMALALAFFRGRRKQLYRWEWAVLAAGSGLVKLVGCSFVAYTSMPGSAIFATFVLFTAAFHGALQRVTPTEPFVSIGTLLAVLAGLAMNTDADHVAIFSILIPTAVTIELFSGTVAATQAKGRKEADRLRAAVAAEILDRQSSELRRLSDSLVEVLGHNHDINNAMTSIELDTDALALLLERPTPPIDLLRETTASHKQNVQRVRAMLETIRDSRPRPADAECVDVSAVIESVVREVSGRFGSVHMSLGDELRQSVAVRMRGGAVSVHRVFLNLVTNACEGNGVAMATEIRIRAARGGEAPTVTLTVEDNGPGFDLHLLNRPIEGLATSKKSGTGLGLYTSERLVRASGGAIERANRPEGGAIVSIVLPSDSAIEASLATAPA